MTESADARQPWGDLETRIALDAASASGQPPRSIALYARWWQLETWLREVVYVELRAWDGRNWATAVKTAIGRQNQDAEFTHMASTDGANPLAYLDYSQLIKVIDAYWDLFSYALLQKASWDGRQEELKRIRHRIGHMRRPHDDDLGRLEQTLRDLEGGTFVALSSYNRTPMMVAGKYSDPVSEGWVDGKHPTARRLIDHAERQYDVTMQVSYSLRPWAQPVDAAGPDGHLGALWRVDFFFGGRRDFNVRGFWQDFVSREACSYLVHILIDDPFGASFTFAAVDGGQPIADAIGSIFDCILTNSRYVDGVMEDDEIERWKARAQNLDYRVLVSSGWGIVSADTVPITLFNAGSSTTVAPQISPRRL